ncbi:MAG TPA: class I SAM-dependent methyltransferase [Actinocrinis sp.]|uniref:class I SAM-dependent methyltransferase n=1 Tax=Actinocrinis sp. TaxID=1920516 RepID=UPI002DDDA5D0|nr:class I SAM-dependent methyltransferase [Actinocrinis sp.]HEV3173432.1 class I SAM-dependent methyltransferase [Actinocrinis sp.]
MAERSKFDTVAELYAAGRPDYPAELYDTLEAILGRPLAGAHAVDLGAGTGIASRQLAARGARVTALELSGPMIAQLTADSAGSAGVRPVQGSATAIPLRDSCADLVTCAQAWHWIDPALGIPEFLRVLRPGGVFGAWWNRTLRELDWERAQEARIDAACGTWAQVYSLPTDFDERYELTIAKYDFFWDRRVMVDRHLENLASKSYIAELPDPAAFIATERELLREAFPDGRLTERFATHLIAVRTPADTTAA